MILEAIYNGNFYPSETVVPKSERYRNALKACEKIMDRLAERLNMSAPEQPNARPNTTPWWNGPRLTPKPPGSWQSNESTRARRL